MSRGRAQGAGARWRGWGSDKCAWEGSPTPEVFTCTDARRKLESLGVYPELVAM